MCAYGFYEDTIELILPEDTTIVHGVSSKTGQIIIWTTKDARVMGLNTHSGFNTNMMHQLVVNKLYENGKIDDAIKMRFIEAIYDTEKSLTRHTILKVVETFLKIE